jgi:peptidoglycan/LPS O-acetylase OafA/YrhL
VGSVGRTQLHALTSVRFFAALLVVLFHFGGPLLGHAPKPVVNVVAAGYVGVSFFFVLSGFVLAYAYARLDRSDVGALRAFYAARIARIYPAYLLSIVAIAPFAARSIVADGAPDGLGRAVGSGVAALALLQGWFPATVGAWNFPAWSLSAELLFYALFPFALPLLRKASLRLSLTLTFVAAIGLACLPSGRVPVPLLHVPQFLFGVALGVRFSTRPAGERSGRGPLLAIGAATLLALVLTQSPRIPSSLLQAGLLAPLFGTLVYGLAEGRGRLAAALAHPWLVTLGEASYAVYILQVPVLDWLKLVPGFDTNRSLSIAGYIALLVALSVAVHRTVEVPGRRLLLAFATWILPPSEIGARIPVPRVRPARQAPGAVVPPPALSNPASAPETRSARIPGEPS